MHKRALSALASFGSKEALDQQRALTNALLSLLAAEAPKGGVLASDAVAEPSRRLVAVHAPVAPPLEVASPPRPTIPLAESDLLVNGAHDLRLGPELEREIGSADRIDLLCSFLKWSGLRMVRDALRDFVRRRPGKLRVLTTAYMAATDRRALDVLVELGAQVRVSYDTSRTRLHAKAWLLHRDSGFSTAFIGSSNLSRAAMLDGLEWNVRLSKVDNGAILDKFAATFEQYYADGEFADYDPETFDRAVDAERRTRAEPFLLLDVTAKPHQQEILDELAAERAHGHHRNLVVAATGTGKTVVAALDYRRVREQLGSPARLLFIAHRKEILDQSHKTFQVVLRDGAFGERLVDGEQPSRWDHVFATVQSMHAERLERLPTDHFAMLIVDEFHHAAAPTYARMLAHFRPRVLLGLTATPERADGASVLGWFDERVASELRLWKALDNELLSPFHYFGIGGGPDLRGVTWSRGRYDERELSNVYTADHWFAKRVLQEVHRHVTDVHTMRALAFCVDIAHAEFMAARFTEAGIAAEAVSSRNSRIQRTQRLTALRDGGLRVLCSVDLFNEGVDLPDVDTVIFLRPTESATVFLQQLGRGLRRSRDKACLTVLDFIGDAHRRFRFDQRFRAIVGGTRRAVRQTVERGFPQLPAGCAIRLDEASQRAVLENIEHALGLGPRGLVEDLRELARGGRGSISLEAFLRQTGSELEDIYVGSSGGAWSWTRLRREAGLEARAPLAGDEVIERAFSRMLHVDDPARLAAFRELVAAPTPPVGTADVGYQRMLAMLLGQVRRPLNELGQLWRELWASPGLRDELMQLLALLDDRSRRLTKPLPASLAGVPLAVHATYSLDEVMAAVDERDKKGGVKRIQTGVYYVQRLRTDLLFVTLEKSERDYSPTTRYNDYPLSPTRFHWETQSSCHSDTPTGQRYLAATESSGQHVLLFVRKRRKDERGVTMPYVLLGPCHPVAHGGERPMQITWALTHPMPASFFAETKVAAG